MQIVIDLEDSVYHQIKQHGEISEFHKLIIHGIQLPKGHGRLIDADDIDNHIVGSVDTRDCPTIIEADKEYEAKVITRGNCMICGKELSEGEGIFFCKECEDKVRDKNNSCGLDIITRAVPGRK